MSATTDRQKVVWSIWPWIGLTTLEDAVSGRRKAQPRQVDAPIE